MRTFVDLANKISEYSSCSRRKVGAVLVLNELVLGTGFNTTPIGVPLCSDGGCPRGNLTHAEAVPLDYSVHPCIATHAEMNALSTASRNTTGSSEVYHRSMTMVVNHECCSGCLEHLAEEGIGRVLMQIQEFTDDQWSPTGELREVYLGDDGAYISDDLRHRAFG